jgi:hypothetical protein
MVDTGLTSKPPDGVQTGAQLARSWEASFGLSSAESTVG